MTATSILLVSENPLTRKMVRSALNPRGYELLEANDSLSALTLLESVAPELVLQDLVWPDVEQFALPGLLRAQLSDGVPILALVGTACDADDARLFTARFDDTITKPLDASRLLEIVEAHLPEHTSRLERFGAGKRLLLADDDALQLKLTRFRLERLGFNVIVAADGATALLLAKQAPPDAIVADIMMPGLDGFGLSLAIRQNAALAHVPLILNTASYIEESDRELARRAGANEVVVHTPDLRALIDALREVITHPGDAPSIAPEKLLHVEQEHERRVGRQLDRQVLLNAALSRRCSALAAELRVLTGISENVLKHRDLEPAIDEALMACFDAGGISRGALFLLNAQDRFKVRTVSAYSGWTPEQLRGFCSHEALLRKIIAAGQSHCLRSGGAHTPIELALLAACEVDTLLVVPLKYLDRPFGALMMACPTAVLDPDDLVAFAEGLGAQITQVLALAAAFAEESRARDSAEQQAALLNALLLHAPDCIAHLEPNGTILFVNHVMGESHPELQVGCSWLALQRAEHRSLAQTAFDDVISTGTATTYETMYTTPDGSLRCYSNRLGPVRRDGQIVGAMLVARDISARKQAETQLLVSDRMASVGMLAASVAHEINNPLAAMMINLELMERDLAAHSGVPNGERLRKELEDAREAGRRVIQVVRDLKIFSRSNEKLTRLAVRPVLESSLRMAGNEIRHRARLTTAWGDVPAVDADESRLGQVFLNLLVNAAHAMPEGSADRNELRVATSVDEQGRVLITVSDTGCGIPEQDRARLFRPFFTTKAQGVGTGLGLSICERIIRGMGGSIGFESEVGKGTTFWVALSPSVRAIVGTEGPPVCLTKELTPAGRRGSVLIVEDDRMVADVIKRFLSRDHDVRVVTQAHEALELVTREPCFDMILCDLMMPQMTGQQLFAELSKVQAEQAGRIVFMTGGPFTPMAREFLSAVKNRRVEKPFDLLVLRGLLLDLISG